MHCRALRPGGAPVLPALERGGDFLEVGEQHAVRHEPRRPVGDGGGDARVFHIRDKALRIFSGVKGMLFTRTPKGDKASLMAFITAAGAPAVPASPTPFAPSCDCSVGVSTWAQTMSGISPAIGTR